MSRGSVLLVTLPPFRGGVPAKAALLARHLRERGWDVHVAYYATLADHPELVVPSWRLPSGARPARLDATCWDDFPSHAIGCRFPELEAPYTIPSPSWRRLFAGFDRHIAVGGTPLISNLLVGCGIRHLLWCAAPLSEDRRAREDAMPAPRRMLDRALIRPWLRRQERRVLTSPLCRVAGVSRYTCRTLAALGAAEPAWLPIPTDSGRFAPPLRPAAVGTIGFAGRLGDPRKRVELLLHATARLIEQGVPARLRLAGDAPEELKRHAGQLGLEGVVEFLGHVRPEDLPAFYQGLDLFALPSSQEGLGIVGVEAIASGVPVVTATRGSGPDDYVIDGVTGRFVDPTAESLADELAALIADPAARAAMSAAARALAVERYGFPAFHQGLAAVWEQVWGDRP